MPRKGGTPPPALPGVHHRGRAPRTGDPPTRGAPQDAHAQGRPRQAAHAGHAAAAPQQLAQAQLHGVEAQEVVARGDREVVHKGVAGHRDAALRCQASVLHARLALPTVCGRLARPQPRGLQHQRPSASGTACSQAVSKGGLPHSTECEPASCRLGGGGLRTRSNSQKVKQDTRRGSQSATACRRWLSHSALVRPALLPCSMPGLLVRRPTLQQQACQSCL